MSQPIAPDQPGAAVTEPQPATPTVSEPATAITQSSPVATTERCAQCAAPLAHDQRYCLQCGEPRGHLGGLPRGASSRAAGHAAEKPPQSSPVPPGYAPVPAAASATRNNSLALIAGVGVLLLAMGVGVLIGRAGVGTTKTSLPQVIAVGGSSAAPTSTTATTPATSTSTTETPAASVKKKTQAKAKQPAGAGSSITKPASSSVLKELNKGKESGQNYEEKSKSLPNVVLTK